MVGDGKEERKQPHFFEDGGTCGVDDDGEPDDGQHNDGEGDDGKTYEDVETVRYTNASGCLEEEKEDVEDVLDVAPLVGNVARNQQNEGILFGTSLFMFFERRGIGVVKTICFTPLYVVG
ncbi:hypothetical protein V8G54_007121 [Vigna mungo]|uniref:Uncharacterized protein n=1 Tax=Vigna mungo TaxID=3915 RepID=A0AAQ3P133_VIGMU